MKRYLFISLPTSLKIFEHKVVAKMFLNILSNIAMNQMLKIQDNFNLKSLSFTSKICGEFKGKTKTMWDKKHTKFIKRRTRKEAKK